jgi:hypothetical protein
VDKSLTTEGRDESKKLINRLNRMASGSRIGWTKARQQITRVFSKPCPPAEAKD